MPDDYYAHESAELRMIDFLDSDAKLVEGEYHLKIVRIERENGKLVVYARFSELSEDES